MARTVFIPVRAEANVDLVVENILEKVTAKRIGLVTTAQYVHVLADMKRGLEGGGKKVSIQPGRPNPGQILGCDARAGMGDVDCFVYVGSGRFHPLAVAYKTEKPVYIAHPSGGLEQISGEEVFKYQKRKYARISKFKDARKIGIIVSTKPGQQKLKHAVELRDRLKGEGKETFIFVANEIKPENLVGFEVDVWVSTACPRIVDDHFEKPIVDISDI
ncbi:MAG: diphthamide synthesis protein [Candidatus Altiarchaeota archaeon]|nr:diphthamide synthesis protein [Candidatus Altiarchaeota archaeon]